MLLFGVKRAALGAGLAYGAIKSAPGIAAAAGKAGNSDAIQAAQHQVWMCWTSGALGEDYARAVASAHEAGQEETADSQRDWENNRRGLAAHRNGGDCVQGVTNNVRGNPIPRAEDYNW